MIKVILIGIKLTSMSFSFTAPGQSFISEKWPFWPWVALMGQDRS